MQNCNCSPAAMMFDSPMTPEKYRAHPYLFNGGLPTHQRAQMMNELLAAADRVTLPQAIDIAFNPGVYRAERWQARIKEAWSRARDSARSGDAAEVFRQIDGWDRRATPTRPVPWRSTPSSGTGQGSGFEGRAPRRPPGRADPRCDAPRRRLAAVELRLGRGPLWPVLPRGPRGGRPVLAGRRRNAEGPGDGHAAAISFSPAPDGKSMIGHGGQTSTQVIIMTDPPRSYAVIPLGESDHKESGHWDDQAEKLFSKAQAAPTYFLDEPGLLPHVTSTKVFRREPARPAAR